MATQVAVATQAVVATQFNEQKLIRAGQRGDSEAVETLFRRYHRPLFQTALRVLGNAEDAEDALQDGLLSAYRNLKRFEGRSQFSTWGIPPSRDASDTIQSSLLAVGRNRPRAVRTLVNALAASCSIQAYAMPNAPAD